MPPVPQQVQNPTQPIFALVSDCDFKKSVGKRLSFKAPAKVWAPGQIYTCTIPAFAITQPLIVKVPDQTKDPVMVPLAQKWFSLQCPHCSAELEEAIGKGMGKVIDHQEEADTLQ